MGLERENNKFEIKLWNSLVVKKNYIVKSSPFGGRRGVPCISKALTYHHFDLSGGYINKLVVYFSIRLKLFILECR